MAEGKIKDARNRSSRYRFMEGSRREAEMELKRLKERESKKEPKKEKRKKVDSLASINRKLATGEEPKWKKKAGPALMGGSKFPTKK
tara:strand:+ start:213 stop:473 length:261 start_codon:yes stop_codon:yes gene_type:complete